MRLISLEQTLTDLFKELEKYTLLAPNAGNIQNLSGIERGSLVFAGQDIAVLTPTSSSLIAETYVSTRDIGMLHPAQAVKLRVDAYDAYMWRPCPTLRYAKHILQPLAKPIAEIEIR
ncbi:hypothetical protein FACS1894201_11150 [Bacteroidia bacterium]|nr:hypothetical protein FACS1894201_11150 [Bacteroidia bacterium]